MDSDLFNVLKSAKTKMGNNISLIEKANSPFTTHNSLIIGVFHGDEPQGKFLIEEYLKKSTPLTQKSCKNDYPPLAGGSKSLISGWGNTPFASHDFTDFAKDSAKTLRNNSTVPEIILWKCLKGKQLRGLKFRRQQPIGKYIVDFMCCYPKIIIELDGGQHNDDDSIEYDKKRDEYLRAQGFHIIRIWNDAVYNNINGVIDFILRVIDNPAPKSKISTLPQGEGNTEIDTAIKSNLLFIPCLNPDGMQLGTRTNANGVDLNRNFPTKNWGEDTSQAGDNPADYFGGKSGGSEIETQFVIDVIEKYKPELIITLHAPYKIVNYDGPAEEIAEKISKIIKYPVEASIGYPTPGSFGTYAGIERQIPTITLELDETCPVEDLIKPVHQIFDLFTI